MCLYLQNNFPYEGIVTNRPIVVWKWLEQEDGKYLSPYRGFRYEFGRKYRTPIGSVVDYCSWLPPKIHRGLHAFTVRQSGGRRVAYPSIIPAGSRIYLGRHSEIVSNQLIVFKNWDELVKRYPGAKNSAEHISKFTKRRV